MVLDVTKFRPKPAQVHWVSCSMHRVHMQQHKGVAKTVAPPSNGPIVRRRIAQTAPTFRLGQSMARRGGALKGVSGTKRGTPRRKQSDKIRIVQDNIAKPQPRIRPRHFGWPRVLQQPPDKRPAALLRSKTGNQLARGHHGNAAPPVETTASHQSSAIGHSAGCLRGAALGKRLAQPDIIMVQPGPATAHSRIRLHPLVTAKTAVQTWR